MGQINRISKAGLELIKGFEGLRRRSDRIPGGGWIVGYGHTRSAREGVEVTEREAEYLLRYDLQDIENFVQSHIHAPLDQNEFDALVSFCWNIGKDAFLGSDVLNYVNAGEMLAAAESFSAWRKARIGGRLIVVDALVRRRTAEKNMFLSHPNGPPSAPSLIVRPELDVAASVLALSDGALSIEAKMNAPDRNVRQAALPQNVANDQFANFNMSGFSANGPVADDIAVSDTELTASAVSAEHGTVWDAEDDNEEADDLDDADYADLDVVDDDEDNQDNKDTGSSAFDELSRAMAAANLQRNGEVLTEPLEVEPSPERAEIFHSDTDDLRAAVIEDVKLDDDEISESVWDNPVLEEPVLEEFTGAFADEHETEAEADAEIYAISELIDLPEEEEAEADDQRDSVFDMSGDLADDATANETLDDDMTAWNGQSEAAFEVATMEQVDERQRIIIDDVSLPNGMTTEELEAYERQNGLPGSGMRGNSNSFVSILPFVLLTMIGVAMMVLGMLDWWKLIQADAPTNENELYAGPFLTLIGGFGLVFGLYFMIRKLFVKDA